MQNKQLADYTGMELKALAFEQRELLDQVQQNLSLIRQELHKRAKKVPEADIQHEEKAAEAYPSKAPN